MLLHWLLCLCTSSCRCPFSPSLWRCLCLLPSCWRRVFYKLSLWPQGRAIALLQKGLACTFWDCWHICWFRDSWDTWTCTDRDKVAPCQPHRRCLVCSCCKLQEDESLAWVDLSLWYVSGRSLCCHGLSAGFSEELWAHQGPLHHSGSVSRRKDDGSPNLASSPVLALSLCVAVEGLKIRFILERRQWLHQT